MKDEISELCDDILIRIISFLSFKEAVRSSAISHRWQHLWKYFSGCLSFQKMEPTPMVISDSTCLQIESGRRSRFAKWLNNSLNSIQSSTMDEFRVTFDLDNDFKSFVDEWVGIALQKKVRKLQLNFAPELSCWDYMLSDRDKACRCYCLTKQTLISSSAASFGIHFLTCLSLRYVGISDEILEYILSTSPLLESLDVSYSHQLRRPKFSALRLKRLKLFFCYYAIRSIEIYAPNLVSFEYSGKDITLRIKYAPELKQVCYYDSSNFGYPILFDYLVNYLPQLVTLSLGASIIGALLFPKLTSLKHLRCEAFATHSSTLSCLASLIEKAPFLHKFELEFRTVGKNRIEKLKESELREMWRRVREHPNEYIKEVEIIGFIATKSQAKILAYLLKNAVMLEMIRIDTSRASLAIEHYITLERGRHCAYRAMTKKMADFMIDHLIQNRSRPQLLLI